MLLVYCVVDGHPAGSACEDFLRARTGWFTSPLVLFEAKAVLTKIYGVDPLAATSKLATFCTMPVVMFALDDTVATSALGLADTHRIELTDAVLLDLALRHGAAFLATEDRKLATVCTQLGITPECPLDATLRQQVVAFEAANLAPKGVQRILRSVHHWMSNSFSDAAEAFWDQSSHCSRLP
jgi:predicted nucleic acid-binding protein